MAKFKKIIDRTDEELKEGIETAKAMCEARQIDFWVLVTGIDSFFEQRNRKNAAEAAK